MTWEIPSNFALQVAEDKEARSEEEEKKVMLSAEIYKKFNAGIVDVFTEEVPSTPTKAKNGMNSEFSIIH